VTLSLLFREVVMLLLEQVPLHVVLAQLELM
jgi:hypothetical protein